MDNTLGGRIAMLRKKKELTQENLAQKLNVSAQAVSKWENNQTCPDISLLPRLAGSLDVTTDELLSGEPSQKPEVRMARTQEDKNTDDMVLRITVDSSDGDRVRINLPVALIQAAIELGIELPQISGSDALKSIDIRHIMELVCRGARGNLIEVDTADGDTVRISVE